MIKTLLFKENRDFILIEKFIYGQEYLPQEKQTCLYTTSINNQWCLSKLFNRMFISCCQKILLQKKNQTTLRWSKDSNFSFYLGVWNNNNIQIIQLPVWYSDFNLIENTQGVLKKR
ncbi:hypothetical protein ABPG74_002545 [Tetrahymena malaccensis]